uniref:uncharacterized protein LOC122580591 n=1 Tax=Erigeron canadensis TaxID=72917 RepID=UPI001CB90EEA|nr:uncharacterized protein LOC122580591 [Erigeron canadensis]
MNRFFEWNKKADAQSHTTSHSAGASSSSGPSADNLQTMIDQQEQLVYDMFTSADHLPQSVWSFAMCLVVSQHLNTQVMDLEANNPLKQIACLLSEAMTTMGNEFPREVEKRARERELERAPEAVARKQEMLTIVGALDELKKIVADVNELGNKIEEAKARSEGASRDEVKQITGFVNYMSSKFTLASVGLRTRVTNPIYRACVNLMRLDNI